MQQRKLVQTHHEAQEAYMLFLQNDGYTHQSNGQLKQTLERIKNLDH